MSAAIAARAPICHANTMRGRAASRARRLSGRTALCARFCHAWHHEIPALTAGISRYKLRLKIDRTLDVRSVRTALRRNPIVAVIGPRQSGKTTLARRFVPADSLNYFDLEDPQSLARLSEPDTALRPLKGRVVIDEIQRRPELFPILRVLADRRPIRARFLILGRASPELLKQSSETLAGRMATIPLEGFRLADLGVGAQSRHWLRGGFLRSFIARSEADSFVWRRQFLQTFLERDMPQFGVGIPAVALHRFWNMVAHYHGQIWNAAELARALAINESTVRRYLDLMTGVPMIRRLPPGLKISGSGRSKLLRSTCGIPDSCMRCWA